MLSLLQSLPSVYPYLVHLGIRNRFKCFGEFIPSANITSKSILQSIFGKDSISSLLPPIVESFALDCLEITHHRYKPPAPRHDATNESIQAELQVVERYCENDMNKIDVGARPAVSFVAKHLIWLDSNGS